jgi:hypothetical protein
MLKKFFSFLKLAYNSLENKEQSKVEDVFNVDFIIEENSKKFESFLINNYLPQSNNPTELKYKVCFLHLFLQTQGFYIKKLPLLSRKINEISQQLINSNETKFYIYDIFNKAYNGNYTAFLKNLFVKNKHRKTGNDKFIFANIFFEDNDNEKNKNISKEIYKDFLNCGLFANSLTKHTNQVNQIAEMQNFKLSEIDFKIFESQFLETNPISVCPLYYDFYLWKKIIINEDSIENLHNLSDFFQISSHSIVHIMDTYFDEKDFQEVIKEISKKISYLEMEQEIPNNQDKQVTKPKKNKI